MHRYRPAPSLTQSIFGGQLRHRAVEPVLDFNQSAEVHAEQVIRLLKSMKNLSDENAALLQQQEKWEAIKIENQSVEEAMERFREKYRKQCEDVKKELVAFRQRYPHIANPTNGVHTPKEAQRVKELENMMRQLYNKCDEQKKQLEEYRKGSLKKDRTIKKYEEWYAGFRKRAREKSRIVQQQLEEKNAEAKRAVAEIN